MALNFNQSILSGRVATVPEVKQTQTGKSVVNFRLAVNLRFSKGENTESDFFSVRAWGGIADLVGRYFTKGSAICVVGHLQNRNWEKDGAKHYETYIEADQVYFVESKGYKDPVTMPYEVAGQPAPVPAPALAPAPHFEEIKTDDDLPF